MITSTHSSPTKKTSKKNIFLERETLLIVLSIAAALFIATFLFLFLWKYFKIGFVWLMAFIVIFVFRKTDLWKMGVEIHYLIVFIGTYVFGMLFSLPLIYLVLGAVVKVRPDEGQGATVHAIIFTGIAATSHIIKRFYGMNLSLSTFLMLTLGTFIFWIIIDFFLTLKIAPVHWTKALVTHVLDAILNYFYITIFGYTLYQYCLTLV